MDVSGSSLAVFSCALEIAYPNHVRYRPLADIGLCQRLRLVEARLP